MTAREVVGTVEWPGGTGVPIAGARVTASVYAGVDGNLVYAASDVQLGQAGALTDTSGNWSLTLTPNADLTPSGTVYAVTIEPPDAPSTTYWIDVPDTAGPHEATDILAEQPGAVPSQALAAHAALTAAHGATGAVVGTTNTQTLTNKTLTSPALTIGSPGDLQRLATWDVREYGAVAGSTSHNSRTEVQAAIAAASAAGGGTVVLAGLFAISGPVTMADDVRLSGSGPGCGLVPTGSATSGGLWTMVDGSSAADWSIDNVSFSGGAVAPIGVYATGSSRATVAGCTFGGLSTAGVQTGVGTTSGRISGCSFSTCGSGGGAAIFAADTTVDSCRIIPSGPVSVVLYDGASLEASNIKAAAGLVSHKAVSVRGDGVTVTRNRIDLTAGDSTVAAVQSDGDVTNLVISENHVTATAGASGGGITVGTRTSPCTIRGLVISGNTVDGGAYDGILVGQDQTVDTGADIVITGNSVSGIRASGAGADFAVGIEVHADYSVVTGNSVSLCGGAGVWVAGLYSRVSANIVRSVGLDIANSAGIKAANSGVALYGNVVVDVGKSGDTTSAGIRYSADAESVTSGVIESNLTLDTRAGGSRTTCYGVHSYSTGPKTVAGLVVRNNESVNVTTGPVLLEGTVGLSSNMSVVPYGTLPSASAFLRGQFRVKSGTGAEDKVCVCVLSADGSTYKWVNITDGTTVT